MPLDESSATFTILNSSTKKNRLELINFAPGQLKFNLTVTGEFDFIFQNFKKIIQMVKVNQAVNLFV